MYTGVALRLEVQEQLDGFVKLIQATVYVRKLVVRLEEFWILFNDLQRKTKNTNRVVVTEFV